jgi:TPR repeat protein
MSYTIDKDLEEGQKLVASKKHIREGLKYINRSAIQGTTKGKSFFEIGRIIKEGIYGIEADAEESKKYYDIAMSHFKEEPKDSLDYHEMGDYYYYGLGTEEIDKNLALEYYRRALELGDENAQAKIDEIENQMKNGDASSAPVLSPETEAKETASEADEPNPVVSDKAEPEVVASPVVINDNEVFDAKDKVIVDEIDSDQILIKAIRILDSSVASKEEKLDAVELVKIASEKGSIRALVLLGYLYEGDNSLIAKDDAKAKECYESAIAHGSCSAKFRLGILCMDKEFAYYDLDRGHQLIIDAAHDGYTYALCYLGDCFRVKVNDKRNLEVAYRYYSLAGERGLGIGYHNMAEIDASRQQLDLAAKHEKLAFDNGFDVSLGYQDPLFYTLHI